MLIKIRRGWELPEASATPEAVFHDRRRLIKAFAAGPIVLAAPALLAACDEDQADASAAGATQIAAAFEEDPSAGLYPEQRNLRYRLDREVTQ